MGNQRHTPWPFRALTAVTGVRIPLGTPGFPPNFESSAGPYGKSTDSFGQCRAPVGGGSKQSAYKCADDHMHGCSRRLQSPATMASARRHILVAGQPVSRPGRAGKGSLAVGPAFRGRPGEMLLYGLPCAAARNHFRPQGLVHPARPAGLLPHSRGRRVAPLHPWASACEAGERRDACRRIRLRAAARTAAGCASRACSEAHRLPRDGFASRSSK